MDTIDTMRAFATVAQEGSFTHAAKRLGWSTKLVSKYVQALEHRLRTRLLNRTTRSVALTDVGAAYLERCRPILDQVDELDTLVQEKQTALAGPIRLTAPTGFGSSRLAEALVPFMSDHPGVEIDMHLSDVRVAVIEEGFDLAIRIGMLRDSTLIAKKLRDMPLITCAAPDYLNRQGWPKTPEALATHNCIIDANMSDGSVWRFRKNAKDISVRVSGPLRANAPAAIVRLVAGGLGIGQMPLYAIEELLADGRLVPLFTDQRADTFGVYALYPPNRYLTARVRALIDHLAAAL